MTAASLRTSTAAAAVPAAAVVLGHLAVEWNREDGFAARRDLAFSHGVALAVLLCALLIASRVAMHLESGAGAPLADTVAVIGTVAVLADMARLWRDGSNPLYRFGLTASHVGALVVVAVASIAVARAEARRARSNPPPSL
ncbi:MAG TPA: hypothetical protein VGC71_01765 [Gaiellales bacterium]